MPVSGTDALGDRSAAVRLTIAGAPIVVGVTVATERRPEGEVPVVQGLVYLPDDTPEREAMDAFLADVVAQVRRYASDPHVVWSPPLATRGTAFQRRVWAALRAIPTGEVRTYGQLAATIGSVARAVGQACGDNPWPLVVPCHRVIAARGLGGFSHTRQGAFVEMKRRLLIHEGVLAPCL